MQSLMCGIMMGFLFGMLTVMGLSALLPKYATYPKDYEVAVKSCVQLEWVRGDEFKCKPIKTGDK